MHHTTLEQHLINAGLATLHRGRLIPIIRGGDGREFPDIPKTFDELTDEELEQLREEFAATIKAMRAGDEDLLGEMSAQEVIAKASEYATAALAIKDLLETRKAADENYQAELDELAVKVGLEAETGDEEKPADEAPDGADEETDGDTDGETEEVTEPEAVAAAATDKPAAAKPVRRPLPAARRHRATAASAVDERGLRARVNSEEIGVRYGDQLGRTQVGELLSHMVRRNKVSPGDRMIVASATIPFPESRFLGNDGERNFARITDVVGPQALVASGGLCAPLEPIYDLPGVETAARPVRDALPSFQANRGGVIVGATPTMGVYADAVGVVTADDNASGGSLAVKNCLRIECPEFSSVTVDSIYQCIEADNLAIKAYPELMARIDMLVRAEQARLADGKLLDEIKSGSTQVTATSGNTAGGTYALLGDLTLAAAGYRNRHRMDPAAILQAYLPAWVGDLLALDNARNASEKNATLTRAGIAAYLRDKANIAVTWYLDGTADGGNGSDGQVFGVQTATTLVPWPTSAEWFLFAPGTWLHLDAGTLDLGVVRDSSLNSTNDFQVFAETWEQVAFVGVESIVGATDVCPSGTFAAGVDLSSEC